MEKPLATTRRTRVRAIMQAAQASGQVMMTAQTLRFDAAVKALQGGRRRPARCSISA